MLPGADTAYEVTLARRIIIRNDHGAGPSGIAIFTQGFCESFGAGVQWFTYMYACFAYN